ncbi:MAG: flagellar basal-body MS-ring/collar protein FliF [Candidatus Baltobacteraceae bacterium]
MDRVSLMWTDLASRLRTLWEGQNSQSRMFLVGGIGIVIVGLASLGFFFANHKPTYEVLFSNLAADDAVSVTTRLKDDKVPYTLSGDGKSVYVPAQYVSDERVAIAGAGIVKGGGAGYELFDKMNFGMTEFQEKLGKTRAISGELERTINGLTEVDTSRVHLATPDATLYSSTQEPTTASVAVKTKPGMTLTPQEVKGITLLVANAVEGLKPDDVTIIDQDGNVLLPAAGSVASGDLSSQSDALKMTQEQLVAKQHYESNLQENIQSMLDQTLGKRRAVARVSTKMDFDANSSDTKTYAPAGTVLSQQSKHESYTGSQPARNLAAGVPGTTSNIGTYQAVQNTPAQGNYNKSETTTNYNITEQNSKHIDAPGKILQTSVAVLVNAGAAAAGQQTTLYTLTPGNVAQIRNAVIAAADLNLATGDQVSVEAVPFNPAVTAENTSAQTTTTVLGIPLWVLLALGGVGVLVLLGLVAARSRRRGFSPSSDLPSFDSTLAEELPPFEEHPMLDGAPGIAAPIRSAADLTREQMIEYVTTVAQENPDSIAKLVKLWLAE